MDVVLVFLLILTPMSLYNWIVKQSGLPWLELRIEIPFVEMLEEAVALKEEFVEHRDGDAPAGYSHKGWKSLCIHGISSEKTNHYTQYGYKNHEETPYIWTKASEKAPVTVKFFKETFPMSQYFRVRFMLLEPGGYISPHCDTEKSSLSPINIALNMPKNCLFKFEKHGLVPIKTGQSFLLDVSNKHAYINKSFDDRYHIIAHGKTNTPEWRKLVEVSYAKNGIR